MPVITIMKESLASVCWHKYVTIRH